MAIRVVLVDDSAIVRNVFAEELDRDSDIEVIGIASDPFIAWNMIVRLMPDVVVLNLGMPRMDGILFLRKLMYYNPLPVIVLSAMTAEDGSMAMKALEAGAVSVMVRLTESADTSLQLSGKIKAAAGKSIDNRRGKQIEDNSASVVMSPQFLNRIIAIGASTGGTQAIETILLKLPANMPGIVITQHMPEHFTRAFAERLDNLCAMEVNEAFDGEPVTQGRVVIARGNLHMLLRRSGTEYYVKLKNGPTVNRHRPSVDVLFKSIAQAAGPDGIGVILTGMGKDGAAGMLEMKRSGAVNIAQDESSSIVFGMPKEAIALGGVDHVVSLNKIPEKILELVEHRNQRQKAS